MQQLSQERQRQHASERNPNKGSKRPDLPPLPFNKLQQQQLRMSTLKKSTIKEESRASSLYSSVNHETTQNKLIKTMTEDNKEVFNGDKAFADFKHRKADN